MAVAKYKKGKDGYFSTRVWDGTYTKNGEKHYKHLRSKKSSKDLERKVKELEYQVKERNVVKRDDITFYDYARRWRTLYKDSKANGTKMMYDHIIKTYLRELEFVRLQDIQRVHLQLVLNNANNKPRTQQQILMTFRQIIDAAVAERLMPANVADDILRSMQRVKYKASEKRALLPHEREAVFKADFNLMDKIFVFLLYGCGIRRGEALAITVEDISLDERTLYINKAYDFITIKEPKTKNGYRTLPIPDIIYSEIEQYVSTLKDQGKTYLFTTKRGELMTRSAYRRMWERIMKEMDKVSDTPIEGLTAHIFRHNYCTNLCYEVPRISIKMVAKLLGDKEATVLNVYNHLMMEKEDSTAAINAALNF